MKNEIKKVKVKVNECMEIRVQIDCQQEARSKGRKSASLFLTRPESNSLTFRSQVAKKIKQSDPITNSKKQLTHPGNYSTSPEAIDRERKNPRIYGSVSAKIQFSTVPQGEFKWEIKKGEVI